MSQWYPKSFIVIMFDQEVLGEAAAAKQCHDEILRTLDGMGYSLVRLGIQSAMRGTHRSAGSIHGGEKRPVCRELHDREEVPPVIEAVE